MSAPRHRLDMIDRGDRHVHRWWVSCACGWVGPYRRRRRDAERIYREHANGTNQREAYR